jgi:hypothetical protein
MRRSKRKGASSSDDQILGAPGPSERIQEVSFRNPALPSLKLAILYVLV